MKKIFILQTLLVCLLLGSYSQAKLGLGEKKSKTQFVILGTTKNGEGKKLALYIPSKGMDSRLVSTISNGSFEFKGVLDSPERASISFNEELENWDGMYFSYQLFLVKDTIYLDVEISEMNNNFYFSKHSIRDSSINSYYQNNQKTYADTYGSLMMNPAIMDSLRTFVFPQLRPNLLAKNEELYSKKEHTIIGLYNLRKMLENRYIFDFNALTENEKESINRYFNKIDPSLFTTPDYIVTQSHINKLNSQSSQLQFVDFSLPNDQAENKSLSEIIAQNKYTVLDFWWSGCIPCRKFNQENQKHYATLKAKGIEIVGINVDDGKQKWHHASMKDKISWINLYAGANSKIQADYRVFSFPTKLVFDQEQNLVDFKFHAAIDLLSLPNAK